MATTVKKFLDLTGLTTYDNNIKTYVTDITGDKDNLETEAKTDLVSAINEVNSAAEGAIKSATINGSPTSSIDIYAPTASGNSKQILQSNGSGAAPTWKTGELVHFLTSVSGTVGSTVTGNHNRSQWTGTADGVESLYSGLIITIKVPVAGVKYGVSLNVNELGEHPVVLNANTICTTHYPVNSIMTLIYDADQTASVYVDNVSTAFTGCWKIHNYDANTTYTNVALGQGRAICNTAAETLAKTATLASYAQTVGGIVVVEFANAVQAGATLSINSRAAKKMFYNKAELIDGIIKAGDVASFIYDGTNYDLISVTSALERTGSSNTTDKLYIVGTKEQETSSKTYSQENTYIGSDGKLYSNGNKVLDTEDEELMAKAVNEVGEDLKVLEKTLSSNLFDANTKIESLERNLTKSKEFEELSAKAIAELDSKLETSGEAISAALQDSNTKIDSLERGLGEKATKEEVSQVSEKSTEIEELSAKTDDELGENLRILEKTLSSNLFDTNLKIESIERKLSSIKEIEELSSKVCSELGLRLEGIEDVISSALLDSVQRIEALERKIADLESRIAVLEAK